MRRCAGSRPRRTDRKLAEIRAYAGGALLALDAPVKRLEYWTEYTERRIANGTAARVLR
jgi:hypothetical protein